MKILVSLLMLVIAMPTWARQFDVEVIIFKRNVNAETTGESWPDSVEPISYSNSGSLQSSSFKSSHGVSLLPRSMYQLSSAKQRLDNQQEFQVLLHTAWRQGDRGASRAPIFHFSAGKNYASLYNPDGSEIALTELPSTDSLLEFEGNLQIYVQHYLFANAEFDLRAPAMRKVELEESDLDMPVPDIDEGIDLNIGTVSTDITSIDVPSVDIANVDTDEIALDGIDSLQDNFESEPFLKTYRLNQKRKMKSEEIHYFDHPLMGMVIQVRKVE
ncbi:peptidoglycan binding protein CsiV [Vibrio sp. RC27]